MASKPPSKPPTKQMPISAKTGQIVTAQYAKTHPSTTVVMTVPTGKGK
jgi:hypothetical protein